ncbi:GNAT superfamily N-acetyltransferase [Arcanobacterium pluranimalium]|uniref:GNAT family N-acetyltransferase n=1 Tax=Arcanobacterium pluranimalium TaxID=108028 RepID=UPI0019584CEB|nr:GNAT family N-acetyltransferase [Arcanobacterium pluranimalium]MBM7825502.1 GNAT superfamily N-acetyltransferase [Arcanobacterium pluranimalium]
MTITSQTTIEDTSGAQSLFRRLNPPQNAAHPGAHLGLSWRAISAADIADVVELMKESAGESLTGDRVSSRTAHSELDFVIKHPNSADTLGGWNSKGELKAFAMVEVNPDALTEIQADAFAVVSGEWRGRGIGRQLLEWQDARARQLIALDGRDLPVSIRSMVNSGNLDRRRLLAAGGFSPYIKKNLLCKEILASDLARGDDALARLTSQGFDLVPFTPQYCEELRRLHNRLSLSKERLQPYSPENWLKLSQSFDYDNSYLLLDHSNIIGYTVAVVTDDPSERLIRHYGVERGLRNRGIGTDIIVAYMSSKLGAVGNVIVVPVIADADPHKRFLADYGFSERAAQILYTIDL